MDSFELLSLIAENNRSEKSQDRPIFDRSYIEAVEKNQANQIIVELKVLRTFGKFRQKMRQ